MLIKKSLMTALFGGFKIESTTLAAKAAVDIFILIETALMAFLETAS
jgi:hypothetical protein